MRRTVWDLKFAIQVFFGLEITVTTFRGSNILVFENMPQSRVFISMLKFKMNIKNCNI